MCSIGALWEEGATLRSFARLLRKITARGLYRPNKLGDDVEADKNLGAGENGNHGRRLRAFRDSCNRLCDRPGHAAFTFHVTVCPDAVVRRG